MGEAGAAGLRCAAAEPLPFGVPAAGLPGPDGAAADAFKDDDDAARLLAPSFAAAAGAELPPATATLVAAPDSAAAPLLTELLTSPAAWVADVSPLTPPDASTDAATAAIGATGGIVTGALAASFVRA